jgi:hypothetical protein
MKQLAPLIPSLLISILSLVAASTAAADAAKRPGKAVPQAAEPVARQDGQASPVGNVPLTPGGLRLKLSLDMRDLAGSPRYAASAFRPAYAPAMAGVPAYNPPAAPPYMPYVPRPSGANNPYLSRPAARTEVLASASPPSQAPARRQAVHPFSLPTAGGFSLASLMPSIPILPDSGRSILPTVRKVYPTGEKPLVVVSFKCPTELVGVTPPTIQLLHELVNLGMDGINRTNLLSYNLQQVCQ